MNGSFLSFAQSQRDLALFLELVACVICAFETLVLFREDGRERRWRASFSFYALQGLTTIWLLAGLVVTLPENRLVAAILQSLSYCPLLSYSGRPRSVVSRVARTILLALPLLALSTGVGLALGSRAWFLASSLFLGVPGIILTIRFLGTDQGVQKAQRPFLSAYMILFGLFGLLTVSGAAIVVIAPTFPMAAVMPITAASFCALALTLSLHAWRSFRRLNRGYGRPLTRTALVVAFLSLPVIILAGLLLTVALGARARGGLSSEYSTEADSVSAAVEGPIGEIDREVAILSDMPGIAAFLARPDAASRNAAQGILSDFSRQIEGSCVILDARGRVAVSAGEGFAQTDFANSEWYTDARAGSHGRLLAPDKVTDIPTYYSTVPIWDLSRGIIGVALIARRVNAFFPPLAPGRAAVVIDEHGTILYATAPHLVHEALWPALAAAGTDVDASPQDATRVGASIFSARYEAGTLVPWENGRALLARSFLSIPGVSLVYLGPILQEQVIRVGVLLATLVVLLIILSFTAAGQVSLLDEARVERSESQYRALVENSPDWVSIVDSNGVFLFTNASGRLHLGIGDAATSGIPVESLLGKEHVEEIAACVRRTSVEGSVALETFLPSVSGDVKVWQISFVPLQVSGPTHAAMLIAMDITDVRRAEARLIRAERMEALGTLAAGVAHQFNNINQIALWSLQILDDDPALPSSARSSLRSLHSALDRSVEITTRMLPLSILPAKGGWPHIGEVVRHRIADLHSEIERGNVEMRLDLKDSLPVGVGRGQLDFIVNSLLSNALDALVERPTRRLSVETATVDSMTTLRVTDTGIGIAAEKLSSLFTPFFSEKGEHASPNSPQARVHGVGLSLSVSNSIVGAAGGRIDVESTLGVGSAFTLWLPNASERPATDG